MITTIDLNRKDLLRGRENKPKTELSAYDFILTKEQINKSDYINFIDDDFSITKLKERNRNAKL